MLTRAPLRCGVFLVCGTAWSFAACNKKSEPAAPAPIASQPDAGPSAFPGYDPPPLDELVAAATNQSPPVAEATPYSPKRVEVPPLQPTYTELLPKSETGDPVLTVSGPVGLVVDETLSDPITASATCMQLTTSCIQPASVENGRDRDSCVASAPACKSNHPWDEEKACCPVACQDLYAELRKKNYADWEAWGLVRRSDCFPGMREFMKVAAEADEKAGLTP